MVVVSKQAGKDLIQKIKTQTWQDTSTKYNLVPKSHVETNFFSLQVYMMTF